VGQVAPALYTLSGDGTGLAAATALSVSPGTPVVVSPVTVFNCASLPCQPVPIDVSGSNSVFLTLYGTGIRGVSSTANVLATINGISLPVAYAGAQPTFPGLDQINIQLPQQLSGTGLCNLIVKVDQHQTNTVTIDIR
jgi:uncharacterized protein (TIGR03437 family)